jgi:hypothetical protein
MFDGIQYYFLFGIYRIDSKALSISLPGHIFMVKDANTLNARPSLPLLLNTLNSLFINNRCAPIK